MKKRNRVVSYCLGLPVQYGADLIDLLVGRRWRGFSRRTTRIWTGNSPGRSFQVQQQSRLWSRDYSIHRSSRTLQQIHLCFRDYLIHRSSRTQYKVISGPEIIQFIDLAEPSIESSLVQRLFNLQIYQNQQQSHLCFSDYSIHSSSRTQYRVISGSEII